MLNVQKIVAPWLQYGKAYRQVVFMAQAYFNVLALNLKKKFTAKSFHHSQNVTREKLRKALWYEKQTRKMLINFLGTCGLNDP